MRSKGFTLLELLIAMSIFSFLAAMAYGGLQTVLQNKGQTEQRAEALSQLQTAMLFLQRDLEQAIGRSARDAYGDAESALQGNAAGSNLLLFTRAGVRNITGQPRSQLQRVAYRYEDEQLIRLTWQVLDRADDLEPQQRILLHGVTDIELRYLDQRLQWQDQWPENAFDDTASTGLPRAVEISLEVAGFGKLRRVFRVPPGEAILKTRTGNRP